MAAPLSKANRSKIMDYLKSQDISDLSSCKIANLIKENLEISVSQPTALKLKHEVLDCGQVDESSEDISILETTKSDKTRQLSIEQRNAIDDLLQGTSDRATAETVGVSRQTVWEWRNHDPLFIAELNRQRYELWSEARERLKSLANRALDVLEQQLGSDDPKAALSAARYVLQGTQLLGETKLDLRGPTTSEDVILQDLRIEAHRELDPKFYKKNQLLDFDQPDRLSEEVEALARSRLKKALMDEGLA